MNLMIFFDDISAGKPDLIRVQAHIITFVDNGSFQSFRKCVLVHTPVLSVQCFQIFRSPSLTQPAFRTKE